MNVQLPPKTVKINAGDTLSRLVMTYDKKFADIKDKKWKELTAEQQNSILAECDTIAAKNNLKDRNATIFAGKELNFDDMGDGFVSTQPAATPASTTPVAATPEKKEIQKGDCFRVTNEKNPNGTIDGEVSDMVKNADGTVTSLKIKEQDKEYTYTYDETKKKYVDESGKKFYDLKDDGTLARDNNISQAKPVAKAEEAKPAAKSAAKPKVKAPESKFDESYGAQPENVSNYWEGTSSSGTHVRKYTDANGQRVVENYGSDKKLAASAMYKDGKQVGQSEYKDGKLVAFAKYVDGKKDKSIRYDVPGYEKAENKYYDGELDETHLYKNGKKVQMNDYYSGKITNYVTSSYDAKTGNKVKDIGYLEDGKTLDWVVEYDAKTGAQVKSTSYRADGKTLSKVGEYDKTTGAQVKLTSYQADGKTLDWVVEYDAKTEKSVKDTFYKEDGKTIDHVTEYDKTTGAQVKSTSYQADGTLNEVFEGRTQNNNWLTHTLYTTDSAGKKFKNIYEDKNDNGTFEDSELIKKEPLG